jgi:hypothetical protein
MAKADVVAAQLAVIQAAEVQAISEGLGACYDQGVADQVPSGGASQADIDAAVKAATDPLNEQVASLQQSLTDAQAKAASDLAGAQQALTDMTAKEQLEEQAVAALQSAITQVQTSLDAIKSIVLPILNPPSS